MEEQNKRNGDKMAKSNGHVFPIVLVAIAVVLLVFSNIAVLFFTVRVATDVKEVKERVDRLPNGNSSDNLTTDMTSAFEISSYKQDTRYNISNLQKNFEDRLNAAVDIFQTSLTDVETSLGSAIDICNDQEMNISGSSNSIDSLLNATLSLLQAHTQNHTKEQSEYLMHAMLNVTNTVHGLSEKIDQGVKHKNKNLHMWLLKPNYLIDDYKTRSPTRSICFKLSTERATWFEAKQRCESIGGYLAEVTDFYVHEYVRFYVSRKNKNTFWLGGTDLLHEGHWLWDNSSAKVSFTAWLVGEPNNHGNGEHCMVAIPQRAGEWSDVPCTNSEYFLCMTSGMTDCQQESFYKTQNTI